MFGGMTISPVLKVNPKNPLEAAVAALMRVAEDPEIVKWIEFPNSLLLFAMVRDNLHRGLQGRPLRIPGHLISPSRSPCTEYSSACSLGPLLRLPLPHVATIAVQVRRP